MLHWVTLNGPAKRRPRRLCSVRGRREVDRTAVMRSIVLAILVVAPTWFPSVLHAQPIMSAGRPAQLGVRVAGAHSVRVTLSPIELNGALPLTPALAERRYAAPVIALRSLKAPVRRQVGALRVEVRPDPLTVVVLRHSGEVVQELVFETDGTLSFPLSDDPVLGMGEGGPRPERGTAWRGLTVQFDRRGALDTMEPRWQADAYGSRNPAAMLVGTGGWGLFVPTPWVQVDLRGPDRGRFVPWQPTPADGTPQTERNQQLSQGKGLPPITAIVPGQFDVFVFDGKNPAALMKDFAEITGPAALPPKWALGYMQSHRTLENDAQMIGIVDTFRAKRIPVDAVIYLGTGFTPRGWNTKQPSFAFNPEVFTRDGKIVVADLHARHVKVVLHMVPWDRDKLKTLHGTIPAKPGETLDASHIQNYWAEHEGLVKNGVDAFWPDEGDWFNLFERIKRHQLYYQGSLSTQPNVRPWSLHRNGFPGIAQWGGWVWSGDTESSWKTLEAQVAVGINYSLSIAPFWGSDIGGFYPNNELTGELYARWFQFASFCGSFRSHGRAWWTRLPWGWGQSELGPRETSNTNTATADDDRRLPLLSELNNKAIEPVAKRFAELRYALMPYTYTLARQARDVGMPLMRAMWLHYPDDPKVRGMGSQYLWGRDLLIAPVFEEGATSRDVYLPAGDWYDWWTGERTAGARMTPRAVDLATMPIFVRAGSIIPVDPVRQYVYEKVSEPTTLRVYPGADGEFTLYEDDGISQEYLQGKGTWTRLTWNDRTRRLTIAPQAPQRSTSEASPREFRVMLMTDGTAKSVRYSGRATTVAF
jgi:alpha-glucosidase (family GH31 glycosyl hydrolase)